MSTQGVDECMINVRYYYVSFTVHHWVRSNSSSTTVGPSSLLVTDVSQQMSIPGFLFCVLVRMDQHGVSCLSPGLWDRTGKDGVLFKMGKKIRKQT